MKRKSGHKLLCELFYSSVLHIIGVSHCYIIEINGMKTDSRCDLTQGLETRRVSDLVFQFGFNSLFKIPGPKAPAVECWEQTNLWFIGSY